MADADVVDYEPEEADDMLDEEDEVAPASKASGRKDKRRTKGRGKAAMDDDRYAGESGRFETLDDNEEEAPGAPQRSVEGWIIFVTGVHEEAQEEDVLDVCSDYGDVKNIHVNLDRRTGFVKGYALVEYEKKAEADKAIRALNGKKEILGQKVNASWAFQKGPKRGASKSGGSRNRRQ